MYLQIKGLVSKHLGFDRIIEEVLPSLGDLHVAAVTGDYARGLDTGVIDLALVGRLQMDYTRHLIAKAEAAMGRQIRFGVQLPDLRGGHYDFEREHHLILWRKDPIPVTST
jgi:hypothetical protein